MTKHSAATGVPAVSIVDQGSAVYRLERGADGKSVHTGSVWGPAADGSGEWFGLRHDVNGGEPLRLPSREDAVAWLQAVAG